MTEETLFHEAVSRPQPERSAFLDDKCAGDPALRAAVEALLAAHEASGSFLDQPANPLEQTVDSEPGPVQHGATGEFTPEPDGAAVATTDHRPKADASQVIGGRYTLLQKIGEGGMGEVWVAQQTEPVKRKVALKLIKTGMDSKGVLSRFEQERQALAIMDHPNIARVLDGGMTPTGQPFFVMELVNGLSLTKFCDEARLTPKQRLELFIPICQAVQHAHQKGIVHRDLKPANILVTMIDGRPVPKVIDFGVAKATGANLTDEAMNTQFGAVVGTLEYMSPEQAGFSGVDIDTRADIYSLGVILYELLTGLRPIDAKRFKKAALAEMIRIIQEEEPSKPSTRLSTDEALPSLAAIRQTDPRKLMAELRGELDWVVMKCLEKSRDRRYDSANDLARDVQRYLADEPVEARPPSLGYRLEKMLRRNRVAVLSVGAVAAALLFGIVMASWQAVRATNAEADERTARKIAQNAEIAEREERKKADKFAADNAKLAEEEHNAKIKAVEATKTAVEATREKEAQLERTRAVLFTSQMDRVSQFRDTDPDQALDLLYDAEACPLNMRDSSWNLMDRFIKRRRLGTITQGADNLAAFSRDGKRLALVQLLRNPGRPPFRGKVLIVESATGKILTEFPDFAASVAQLEFSPDGAKLAIVSQGKVQIWNSLTGKHEFTLEGQSHNVTSIAFSADGALLASSGQDNTARIWDLKTAKEKYVLKEHTGNVSAVVFHPNNKRLATGSHDNTVKFWDVQTGKLESTWKPSANPDPALVTARKQLETHKGPASTLGITPDDRVLALDYNADGSALAVANSNWQIEITDPDSGRVRTTIRDYRTIFSFVHFLPDGKSVVTSKGAPKRGFSQWDVATGKRLLSMHFEWGTFFFCKGRGIGVIAGTGKCDLLDLNATPEVARLETEKLLGPAMSVVINPTGDIAAAACADRIFLWDLRTGKLRHTLTGHKNTVHSLAISLDGRTLASCSANAQSGAPEDVPPQPDDVRLWDLSTGQAVGTLPIHAIQLTSLAFSPDGANLAVLNWGGLEPVISVWDVKTRTHRFDLKHPKVDFSIFGAQFSKLAFHPKDGTLALIVGRSLSFWNLETRKMDRQILYGSAGQFGGSHITAMAYSPNGETLLTAGHSMQTTQTEMTFWNPKTGKPIRRSPRTVQGFGGSLSFTPDGRNFLTTSNDGIRVWDVETMQLRAVFEAHPNRGRIALGLGADGRTLVTAASRSDAVISNVFQEGTAELKLWDIGPSPTILTFTGRIPPTLRISPNSKVLLESSPSGTTRLWDLQTGRVRASVDSSKHRIGTIFSPDGRYVVAAVSVDENGAPPPVGVGTNPGNLTAVVNVWDSHTGEVRKFNAGKGAVYTHVFGLTTGMAFLPDGKRLVLLHDTTLGADPKKPEKNSLSVEVVDFATGQSLASYPFPATKSTVSPAVSPDGNTLAIICQDERILLIDLQKGVVLPELKPNVVSNIIGVLTFTPDGTRLIHRRGGLTGSRVLWDWRAGKRVDEPVLPQWDNPNLSPDGRYELVQNPHVVEVVDRTVRPIRIAAQSQP